MDKKRCAREEDDEEDGREGQGVGFVNPNNPQNMKMKGARASPPHLAFCS